MATNFVAHITGNPNMGGGSSVNVRAKPSTAAGTAVLFLMPIGTANLEVLEVQPDSSSKGFNGKVYQWFRLQFAGERVGWVRDDLLSVMGDGSSFGYPNLTQEAYAFGLLRQLLPNGTPAPVPAPTPEPPPPPEPTPEPPTPTPTPTPSGDILGTVISHVGLNLRDVPVNGSIKARLPYLSQVKILGAQPQTGTGYFWAQVQTPQGRGWVRTDYLSIAGDASAYGLSKGDEYPAPLQNYWWIRGQYDVLSNGKVDNHKGWDWSANPNEAIRSGPNGGMVIKVLSCTRCTTSRPNVISQGIPLDSPNVLADPAWGYGYGNAVIVRYTNDLLPASTRERLAASNMGGAHLFVIYAHLSSAIMQVQLAPFAQIGLIGMTGNATGTHVHVEVHASTNPNDTNFGGMQNFDPGILYLR